MRHLRPTIALAALALAAGAADTAAAAAARPALAVGTSEKQSATWRLEGDRFTARFARPLVRGGGPVRVSVRCGDLTVGHGELGNDGSFALADRAGRRLRVRAGVRVIRARLDRDVAASTTWCGMIWERGIDWLGDEQATMRLRRGTPPGCRPGRRERVLMQTEQVLVTSFWAPDLVTAYRACMKPEGRLRPLAASFDGGGGGGASLVLDPFAIGGTARG